MIIIGRSIVKIKFMKYFKSMLLYNLRNEEKILWISYIQNKFSIEKNNIDISFVNIKNQE